MEMKDCPILLRRFFPATSKALIDVEQGEIILRSKGEFHTYHISKRKERSSACTKCCVTKVRNPFGWQALQRPKTLEKREFDEKIGHNTNI